MKLLQIIDQPSTGGGAEKICRELTGTINELGIDVETIYLRKSDQTTLMNYEKFCDYGIGYIGSLYYIRQSIKKYYSESSSNLVIHGHLSRPLYLIPLVSFGFSCHKIFTEHNTNYRRRKFRILRYIEKIIYRKYDRIVCVSNGVADELKAWLSDESINSKISVIYNGLQFNNTKRPKFLNSASEYRFISIGALTSQKGFDVSINALSKLDIDNWSYDILGNGPKESELKKLVAHHGLTHKITFHGYQNNVRGFLEKSHIMLIPSRWEGFGLVAIEGLSCGLTLVTSDVPGMNEITSQNPACIMVMPDNIADLLSGIRRAISKIGSPISTLNSAPQIDNKFTHDAMVRNYIKLYNQLG